MRAPRPATPTVCGFLGNRIVASRPWRGPRSPPNLEVTPAAWPETATQGVPASGSGSATQGVPEEVLAASRAASGEYALVPRQGGRRAAVPQPARSGGAVVFGPQTQEEAALDAVSRRLRGRTERLEAFAQAEVERTRDLERAVLVSLLVISSLWGRASAPTGCSPRGSGQLCSSWVEP